ncbi:ABC transporter permease, partial [Microbacterium testaceum]
MSRAVGAALGRTGATIVLAITGIAFALPLLALLLFTFRVSGSPNALTLAHYAALVDPGQEYTYDGLFRGLTNSLGICAVTVAIVLLVLVPTVVLVEMRYPAMRRVVEFVCLLPLTVPTVVLVVGFVPVYKVVSGAFGSAAWTLSFAIGVIVLPYAYRPIQAN